ncbi:large ribosomal subunit protein mL42-like [Mytilus trossulus]|uniref:large ribosomal subunit protein mL42-like n=1 Tax=Mytilus trossulus TaxID=6551 RepID=UPI003005DDAA
MSASMKNLTFSVARYLLKQNGITKHGRIHSSIQCLRNKSGDDRSHYVALSKDESTVICWHPEPEFPYEFSKPIPRKSEELAEGDSALKVQYHLEDKLRFRKDGPTDKELANMFFTTKHPWFPRPQKKYRKSKSPKDRDHI